MRSTLRMVPYLCFFFLCSSFATTSKCVCFPLCEKAYPDKDQGVSSDTMLKKSREAEKDKNTMGILISFPY